MTRSLLRRALLAAALGMGVTAGLARADGPSPAPKTVVEGQVATSQDAVPQEGVPCDEGAPTHHKLAWLRPRNVAQAVHNHGPIGCYANFNDYSCSSLHSECLWIFGSCRQFYGERCLKGPPPSPVPGFDPINLTYSPPGTYPPTVVQPPCKCR
jgi:hypothetical protein